MPRWILQKISLVAVAAAMAAGCSPTGPDLNSIPATFVGTLEVEPAGRPTKALYSALVALGEQYGMSSLGDGATDGHQWQVQIYCGKNYVGGATTAQEGKLVLFHLLTYGFKHEEDYSRFRAELMALMRPYGPLSELKDQPPLKHEDLLARGVHMKMDVTSQCAPQSRTDSANQGGHKPASAP